MAFTIIAKTKVKKKWLTELSVSNSFCKNSVIRLVTLMPHENKFVKYHHTN